MVGKHKHQWVVISRPYAKNIQRCKICGKKRERHYSPVRGKFYYTYPKG